MVLKWRNGCAKTAKCMRCSAVSWLIAACSVVIAAVFTCFSGGLRCALRRKYGAETAKMMCKNGENIVWKLWKCCAEMAKLCCGNGGWGLRFRLKFIVLRRLWCLLSAVSNPDFPNFTKHSTVLTSILQQINTLYQHFPSAKTAKHSLKTAKFTLKNRRKQC